MAIIYIYHFSRFVMCVTRQGFLSDDKKRALLPKGQSALNFYIYIGIALFVYCFIACLQHWGITFFISIFYFCSLLRPLFFYDSGCRLSIIWLFTVQRYGGSVRYQTPGMPYSAKTFPERLPQMLHIWVFQKTFYRIVWCSVSWNHHFLMHVKRLYDDEMTE